MAAMRALVLFALLAAAAPARAERIAEVVTDASSVRGAVALDGALWLATSGGVLRTTPDLIEEARFTTLDGLPSNDVRAIAARGDQLELVLPGALVRARVEAGQLVELITVAIELPAAPPPARVWLGDRVLECGDEGAVLRAIDGTPLAELRPVGLPALPSQLAIAEGGLLLATPRGYLRLELDRAAGTLDVQPAADVDFELRADLLASTSPPSELLDAAARAGLPRDRVRAIVPSVDGLWVATPDALVRVVDAPLQ
jgi:hypothetical protein